MNPNITWEIVKENLDKPWNWNCLSRNKFQKYPVLVERRRKREEKERLNAVKNAICSNENNIIPLDVMENVIGGFFSV